MAENKTFRNLLAEQDVCTTTITDNDVSRLNGTELKRFLRNGIAELSNAFDGTSLFRAVASGAWNDSKVWIVDRNGDGTFVDTEALEFPRVNDGVEVSAQTITTFQNEACTGLTVGTGKVISNSWRITNYDVELTDLISNLTSDGIYNLLDYFRVYAVGDDSFPAQAARGTGGTASTVNNAVHQLLLGFKGSGGTGSYLDSGFIPSVTGNMFTQDDASFFVWISVADNVGSGNTVIGQDDTTQINTIGRGDNGEFTFTVNSNTITTGATVGNFIDNELYTAVRYASGVQRLFVGDSVVIDDTEASVGLPTNEMWELALNNAGTDEQHSSHVIGASGAGAALSIAQVRQLRLRFKEYFTAINNRRIVSSGGSL